MGIKHKTNPWNKFFSQNYKRGKCLLEFSSKVWLIKYSLMDLGVFCLFLIKEEILGVDNHFICQNYHRFFSFTTFSFGLNHILSMGWLGKSTFLWPKNTQMSNPWMNSRQMAKILVQCCVWQKLEKKNGDYLDMELRVEMFLEPWKMLWDLIVIIIAFITCCLIERIDILIRGIFLPEDLKSMDTKEKKQQFVLQQFLFVC